MAQLILSQVGSALGARIAPVAFRSIGAALGQSLGSALGARIDDRLFGVTQRVNGPRLTDLHIQASTEGASIPYVFGGVRLAGQVIWAARFKEHVSTQEVQAGGKGGGGGAQVTHYRYSLSFAVGLCEGEIARIGRVWANGQPFDLSSCAHRVYAGSEDQDVDPLIEAIEGFEAAPAYRGLAYVVFEDLPLDGFGNALPQLSFEVFRYASGEQSRLEDKVEAVCLIPGAGEFVYATQSVRRVLGPGIEAPENTHAEAGRANFLVALDQLKADLPNCASVMLVVAWFGNDLRAGECKVRPGVEIREKSTRPLGWRAGGVDRAGAHLISTHDRGPAFGGTPADESVLQAIAALKARGYKVGLYPFLLMDVPAGNALPDPYGGAEQAPYPWRGRISLHPAQGRPGTPDKTPSASAQIDAFFGDAAPSNFTQGSEGVEYDGPEEWSYRRFILHYAKLAAAAGGVDSFILGSELRGLTTARDGADTFPAVQHLKALAQDVRAIAGGVGKLTYAADWSEYFGYHPTDGSNDVLFHLDPLWSDPAIDCVGVDWYPPLSDWRHGHTHLDRASAASIHDLDYLRSRVEGGEGYDWYYASDEARAAQQRTPITDGAYGEPQIFRPKDLRGFWGSAHYNRLGGVRQPLPTSWVPYSKPIWLVELGCPAIDKGANSPNLFVDPKSAENAAPHASTGARDDLIQRRLLEAYLSYWSAEAGNNPSSPLYGAPMIDTSNAYVWCWDARPFPAFPARRDVWADGPLWRVGHWLSGRAGATSLPQVVKSICERSGVADIDVSGLSGIVAGYSVDGPSSARDALEPLMLAYDFFVRERDGVLSFEHPNMETCAVIDPDDLVEDDRDRLWRQRGDPANAPREARVRFLDMRRDYGVGAVSARAQDAAQHGVIGVDAPLVLEPEAAAALAERLLIDARAHEETAEIALGLKFLALEPGDHIEFQDCAYVIEAVEDAEARSLALRPARRPAALAASGAEPGAMALPPAAPRPAALLLELPPLPTTQGDDRPRVAMAASPWLGAHRLYLGADSATASVRALVDRPAIMGELITPLPHGPVDRWDEASRCELRLHHGALVSVDRSALLAGANLFAVEGSGGEWELLQVRIAEQIGQGVYALRGFLRGLAGAGPSMRAPAPVGARVVALNAALAPVSVYPHERLEELSAFAPPPGRGPMDVDAWTGAFTRRGVWERPFAPVRLRAKRLPAGDIRLSWIRQGRLAGQAWAAAEIPLDDGFEAYEVDLLSEAGQSLRAWTVAEPQAVYALADQIADFGAPPAIIRFRVAQLGQDQQRGLKTTATIPL